MGPTVFARDDMAKQTELTSACGASKTPHKTNVWHCCSKGGIYEFSCEESLAMLMRVHVGALLALSIVCRDVGMVGLLSHNEKLSVQTQAAQALNAIASGHSTNQLRIGLFPGAVPGLVGLLDKDYIYHSGHAAAALHSLCTDCVTNQQMVLSVPKALPALQRLCNDKWCSEGIRTSTEELVRTLDDHIKGCSSSNKPVMGE